jgi:hypothetical protein
VENLHWLSSPFLSPGLTSWTRGRGWFSRAVTLQFARLRARHNHNDLRENARLPRRVCGRPRYTPRNAETPLSSPVVVKPSDGSVSGIRFALLPRGRSTIARLSLSKPPRVPGLSVRSSSRHHVRIVPGQFTSFRFIARAARSHHLDRLDLYTADAGSRPRTLGCARGYRWCEGAHDLNAVPGVPRELPPLPHQGV